MSVCTYGLCHRPIQTRHFTACHTDSAVATASRSPVCCRSHGQGLQAQGRGASHTGCTEGTAAICVLLLINRMPYAGMAHSLAQVHTTRRLILQLTRRAPPPQRLHVPEPTMVAGPSPPQVAAQLGATPLRPDVAQSGQMDQQRPQQEVMLAEKQQQAAEQPTQAEPQAQPSQQQLHQPQQQDAQLAAAASTTTATERCAPLLSRTASVPATWNSRLRADA